MSIQSVTRTLRAIALVLPVVALTGQAALAEDLTFQVKNTYRSSLTKLYLVPYNAEAQTHNILEGNPLIHGESDTIDVKDGLTSCNYDLVGEFADGTVLEDISVHLCGLTAYTIEPEGPSILSAQK